MALYNDSQVPTPSANAWRVDMGGYGGPCFVVLRTSSTEACEAVVEHLIEIGFGVERAKIEAALAKATITEVAVIW